MTRFEGLPDYAGKICGVDDMVASKPFLYFCKEPARISRFDHRDRICVSDCRVGAPTCPGKGHAVTYPTVPYAGILCLPMHKGLLEELREVWLDRWGVTLFMAGIAFTRAWPAIFLSVVVCIATSFLYLCLIARCKRPLVLCGLFVLALVVIVCGIYEMEFATNWVGPDSIYDVGDENFMIASGVVLVSLAVAMLVVSLIFAKNLNTSILCIKAGAECIWDSPSIVFEPFVHLAVKLTFLVILAAGFLRVIAWTDEDEQEIFGEKSVKVHIHYNWYHVLAIWFWIFISAWIMEINSALSYFSTAYATEMWYFSPYQENLNSKEAPRFAACSGYAVALRFHMGTLIYGALVIPFFRVPRMLMGAIFYGGGDDEDEEKSSAITKCMLKSCFCCYNVYDNFLRFMNRYAYMDAALNGTRFCKASYFASSMMHQSGVRFLTTHGAAWLVQFLGLCFVMAVGGIQTYFICRSGGYLVEFGTQAADTPYYIPRPSIMAFVSAIICGYVAQPFICLPGHVADTILFCYAVERKRAFENPLKSAVESTGMLERLTSCTGNRNVKGHEHQHEGFTMREQPPAVRALLEENESAWFS